MTAERRYLLLGLRLGRHVDGLVDAYYGPPELAEQANAGEPVAAAALAEEADALLAEVPDGWLADQLRGLRAYAGVLAGEGLSYVDEVERCYGVRPVRTDEAVYAAAHEALDDLLPGDGSLLERREAWKTRNRLDGERLFPLLRDLLADLRRRTIEAFGLPDDEEIVLEPVDGEPWWAFNYYQGGLVSRVVVNVDLPTTVADAVHLAAHEGYPGHHTEHAWKERLLVQEGGRLEESILLVPTPQSIVSEGIAEVGPEILLDDDALAQLQRLLAEHGIDYDAQRARAIDEALEPLRTVSVDAALLIHEEGRSTDEAQAYIQRWSLVEAERAAHGVAFVTDPTWRAYTINYSAGRDVCRAWVGGDPARFRRLLTEQIRVSELVAALSSPS
ncbi:MAG TPA: hypothetical protein VFW96_10050 [Thermomicrobiales bacterium]|nr:hypothetical protein [Thermomicrobiales bacterium]